MAPPKNYPLRVRNLLRKSMVTSPPVPIEKIAKALSIKILRSPLADDLSGLLVRHKGFKGPIIGVNSIHPRVRQRFTIAHEIAHYILHADEVHIDRGFSVNFRDSRSSSAEYRAEIEANNFAAEILMPKMFLDNDLENGTVDMGDENGLLELAERYGVSGQAMAFRIKNLGYL